MNDYTTELINALASGEKIEEIIRREIENGINKIMENELTAFLHYEKYSVAGYNTGDSRNGTYDRTVHSKFGDLRIKIPRDRNGEFEQHTVPAYARSTSGLEDMVILMYQKGITTSEISDMIEKMYGHHYCRSTVSNIAAAVLEDVKAFHHRPLAKRYAVIYCDATYLNVRRDHVEKEALHVLIGITPEGHEEVIDYALYPTEAASHYMEMMQDIKARGAEQVLLFVSDGLSGFRDACKSVYPSAEHQSCWVHLCRSVIGKVRTRDRNEVLGDLKPVYEADNEEEALLKLADFCSKYDKRYPKVVAMFKDTRSLFSFYRFPKEIRKSLYTSNIVENMNKQLKRITKRKEQFTNEEALDKCVFCFYNEYNVNHSFRKHRGFKQCQYELEQMFDTIYPSDDNDDSGGAEN